MTPTYLVEKLTFDQLFRISDPKRVLRSHTVHGPPLEVDSYQDAMYYAFNFKSDPSTTGLRHRGYIKFVKPRLASRNKPLQHVDCVVDCECPDYKYRWAWANKQRGSSTVGPNSLSQCINRAPRITNPKSVPGLCKHLLALREYIYGQLAWFSGKEKDLAIKLDKLTKHAQTRWINYPEAQSKAKERAAQLAKARSMRNIGVTPPYVPAPPKPAPPKPAAKSDVNAAAKTRKYQVEKPVPLPPTTSAPTSPKPAPAKPRAGQPPPKPAPKAPGSGSYTTKQNQPKAQGKTKMRGESVDKVENVMRKLNIDLSEAKEALKLVEELEQDAVTAGSPLEPTAPPVEGELDAAAVDPEAAEGETALSLLRKIEGHLAALSTALVPEEGAIDAEENLEVPGEEEDVDDELGADVEAAEDEEAASNRRPAPQE